MPQNIKSNSTTNILFDTPLNGGFLIVGSLIWDDDQTRVFLRDKILYRHYELKVPAPIRYGRRSDKRKTYTMVVSSSCRHEGKIGQGIQIPFVDIIVSSIELDRITNAIISAENKRKISFKRFHWEWGCIALLLNPDKITHSRISQLKKYWHDKFTKNFTPNEYIVEGEATLLSSEGELLLEWKKEYGDLDFIILTLTKPTIPTPNSEDLANTFSVDDSYFINNRNHGITTYQDDDIMEYLLSKKIN